MGTPVAIQSLGATGQWSHVVGVYDGAKLSLYMDGQLTASQELARSELLRRTVEFARRGEIPTALQDSTQPFELGGGGFQGLIDEVDFWDVALSAEQVTKLFDSYPPAPSPPPRRPVKSPMPPTPTAALPSGSSRAAARW